MRKRSTAGALALAAAVVCFSYPSSNVPAEAPPAGYAGSATCVQCHARESKAWPHSTMAQALESVEVTRLLIANPELEHRQGQYVTKISRQGNQSVYTVTDGQSTWSAPIRWAFGQGAAGQTYVLEKDGAVFESRVSYYKSLKALDLTMGAQPTLPKNLEEASGRRMFRKDARDCFGCHSLTAFSGDAMLPTSGQSGVQCENCHGPALEHVQGFKQNKVVKMAKLSKLNTEEVSELCGTCHRTWAQIAMNGPHGPGNVRFQPYRLANSKCYDAVDRRISCVGCHNPHEALNRDRVSYDSKCLACHTAGLHEKAKVCKVSTKNCVECHMPTVEPPQSHWPFTDHNIRVVRAGDRYPE